MSTAHSRQTLLRLLEQGQAFSCEWRVPIGQPGLASHLPMVLIALEGLGATSERLGEFYDSYTPLLRPLETDEPGYTHSNWTAGLGDSRGNAWWIQFFGDELQSQGLEKTLRTYLPKLMEGVAGSAFHPLIRLGYALDIGFEEECIHALAAWAYAWAPLAPIRLGTGRATPCEVLEQIAQTPGLVQVVDDDGLITPQIEIARLLEGFDEVVEDVDGGELTLDNLADAAGQFYLASGGDFTALHCVTAVHALRYVLPFVDDPGTAVQWVWPAFCGAFISRGSPRLDWTLPEASPSWDTICQDALSSQDNHLIKMVYSCREETTIYGRDDRYRAMANLRIAREKA